VKQGIITFGYYWGKEYDPYSEEYESCHPVGFLIKFSDYTSDTLPNVLRKAEIHGWRWSITRPRKIFSEAASNLKNKKGEYNAKDCDTE